MTAEEIRVLGCLLEKAATTPDNYPLSTNALTSACNQKSSREPVVDYSDRVVNETMLLLRPAGLARTVSGGGRVQKHRHTLDEAWGLSEPQLAVLAVLLLRGPNSPGELRTRTERYVGFDELDDVVHTLQSLADRDEPLVANLGRGPGQSQDRWTHLLSGEPSEVTRSQAAGAADGRPIQAAAPSRSELTDRVDALERRLARLESELGLGLDAQTETGSGSEMETAREGFES